MTPEQLGWVNSHRVSYICLRPLNSLSRRSTAVRTLYDWSLVVPILPEHSLHQELVVSMSSGFSKKSHDFWCNQ